MDKRAAGQYLDKIFGKASAYVAVAYKDQDESWQEHQFSWPVDRSKIIAWAQIHQDANVFICPALRHDAHTRKKGDGVHLRWLWADVDWDKVPEDKRAVVKQRIAEIGSYVVASGSGSNRHVYVDLGEEVSIQDHYRLNTGLREYLYADAKHPDNSLLRLPGTTNWKTPEGSPVRSVGGSAVVVKTPSQLMELKTFAKVSVMAMADAGPGGAEWAMVDVSGLPRRIKAWASMTVEEAKSRYGTRHGAVWAVTGDLHKRGLDPDMIHTLMDQFPPALDKRDEEHGAYDVHADIEKRLLRDRMENPLLSDDGEDEDVFPEMTLEEAVDSQVRELAERELLRRMGRRMADNLEAERGWVGPPDDVSWSLTDGLKTPPEPMPYIIDGLAGRKHNVVITAQYKTGKTQFVIGSIAASLVDGHDFLDRFPVPHQGTVVGHWNCEMDPAEILTDYIAPVNIQNTDNFYVANLRGYNVNILTTMGKAWAVNWLKDRKVKVWTIDSFARLARMANVSEKDNDEVMSLLMALDEIKVEAEVDVLFLITHTGRMQHEEGKERARGATAIDDWCDARWIMTEESGVRFLAVDGRGVTMSSTSLDYDEVTGRSTLGGMTKTSVAAHGWEQVAMQIVNDFGRPITDSALAKKMIEVATSQGRKLGIVSAKDHITEAGENGFIERKRERGPRGPMVWNNYAVVKPDNDRVRRATPREVNLVSRRKRRGTATD